MKNVRMTICLIVAVLFLSAASFGGTYNGGNGTETEPYQINNITDWQELMTTPDDWNQHFILTADVNLAGIALTPVGNSSTQFTGVFDGNDNIISSGIGLFGYVGSGGQIRNLGVENANILGIFHIGGLVGRNYGTLTACYATGLVSGEFGVGGLVGVNYGTLTACYATGSVMGENEVGGLVGLNYGTLTACYATGSVSGKSHTPSRYAGGLVGYNYGTLTACYATGSVSGITDGYAGGLVGYNEGMLTSCYATGSVTGNSGVGGLVGENSGAITSCYATGSVTGSVLHSGGVGGLVGRNYYGTITSCYATGSVSGKSLTSSRYAGGLVGYNYGTLTACYATGSVSGITDGYAGGLVGYNEGMLTSCYATGSVTGTGSYVGGLVGENDGTITACFWDIETSSQSSSAGGTGKNTADMMKQSTFTDVNWDFTNETTNGTNDYWRMCVDGVDYPRLNWQSTDGDLACPNGVNIEDLDYFVQRWLLADCDSSNNFCGGVDIDISGMVNLTDFAIFADHWLEGVEP